MKIGILRLLGITGFGLAAASCGSSSQYTYHFSYNELDTGEHSFSSLEDLCKGLENDSLNNHCLLQERQEYFKSQGCSGAFQAF